MLAPRCKHIRQWIHTASLVFEKHLFAASIFGPAKSAELHLLRL